MTEIEQVNQQMEKIVYFKTLIFPSKQNLGINNAIEKNKSTIVCGYVA